MPGKPVDVGIFKNKRQGRNNTFTPAELQQAKDIGAYDFAARARGWTVAQLDADFNGRTFRHLINDNDGRRTIASYLATLTEDQLAEAARLGKLDLIAACGGTSVGYWVRVARDGYVPGPGWSQGRKSASQDQPEARAESRGSRESHRRQAMLQRVCWNSSNWKAPTGNAGDGGYPSKMGFGHEEWNFQRDDALDGYIYGYVYYTPSGEIVSRCQGVFDIGFWAIHHESKRRLLVGYYRGATLATDEDLRQLDDYFRRSGIYDRRVSELLQVVPNIGEELAREVLNVVEKFDLRFKCPSDQVEVLPEAQRLFLSDSVDGKKVGTYFARPTYVRTLPSATESLAHRIPSTTGRQIPLAEDGYFREVGARSKRIIRRHNILSNRFADWLRDRGYTQVRQEASGVDVEFYCGPTAWRAELKICSPVGTTKSIREALGQLFEYNYFGGRQPADRWLIVLDETPLQADHAYIERIRDEFSLPLVLAWQTRDGFCPENLGAPP